MADITLGLDFGTHQTKVCVEDASEPRNITYTFVEFDKPDGERSFFLPSVVQLNNDDTLSYGFTDETNAKSLGYEYLLSEPIKKEVRPVEHKMIPEEKPAIIPWTRDAFIKHSLDVRNRKQKGKKKKKVIDSFELLPIAEQTKIHEAYAANLAHVEQMNKDNHTKWVMLASRIKAWNDSEEERFAKESKEAEDTYVRELENWKSSRRERKAIYRYFKIATYSKSYPWNEDINAKLLSVWYMTYLLFTLRERKGFSEFPYTQLGIPESINDKSLSDWQIQSATDVFYCAWDLMKRTRTLDEFLSLKVDELRSKTITFGGSKEKHEDSPYILVLPEAFASLESITSQGKLKRSNLHLLMDIGGGSTDISLFYVTDKGKPNISAILSLHKGLNYIFRLYQEDNLDCSMEQIRELFRRSPDNFRDYVQLFFRHANNLVQERVVVTLFDECEKRGFNKESLKDALRNRPVVYAGGGGVYRVFNSRPVHYFMDPLSIADDLLSVRNIRNKSISNEEMSILTVAYGLSIPQRRRPVMTPLDKLFGTDAKLEQKHEYIHGLTDVD